VKSLLIILLCASVASAQIQGNRPTVIDSQLDGGAIIGGTQGVITWQENLALNDTITLCFNTQNDGSTFSLASSPSESITQTSVTTTPAPQTGTNVWMAYFKTATPGAHTITLTETSGTGFYYMSGMRFSGLGSVDGAVATTTTGSTLGVPSTMSTSKTTTTNNDILVNCSGGAPFGTHFNSPGNTEAPAHEGASSPSISSLITMYRAGTVNTYTPTENIFSDVAFGSSATFAMQTLAFTPSTILIADTAGPDGGNGVAYSAQLHCIGGTSTQTYSLFSGSLPTGLSLNTTTGKITGTPTVNGTSSPQFKCTDGTVTSAAQTVPITIGAVLGVPTVRQINGTWSGDNGGTNFTFNVNCGSIIMLFMRGSDTHGSDGFLSSFAGLNNYVKDSFNSPVRRSDTFIPGTTYWPVPVIIIGPVTQSGADTITMANNQASSNARPVSLAAEITGGNVWDAGSAVESLTATGSISLAPSYTTLVNNTMLLSMTDIGQGSPSISSPFSSIPTGADIEAVTQYSSAVIPTPQSVTATTSVTGANSTFQQNIALLIPVRPALPVAGCPTIFVGTGEKIRRQVY